MIPFALGLFIGIGVANFWYSRIAERRFNHESKIWQAVARGYRLTIEETEWSDFGRCPLCKREEHQLHRPHCLIANDLRRKVE